MPDPKDFDNKNDFMESCVSEVVDEGKDHDQAVGQCSGMWENKEKKMKEKNIETRCFNTEFRVLKDDGKSSIEGYAARFDRWSEDLGGFKERIKKGAFRKALKQADVRALFNHDPNFVLGRSTAGTLALKEDNKGLMIVNDPPDTQWARDLMVSIDRGDISQMSFGFTVEKDEWNEDKTGAMTRTIHEIGSLLDVSAVTYPAYPDTTVALRSMEKHKKEKDKPIFTPVDIKEPVEERELTTEEIKTIVSEVIDKVAALKVKPVVEKTEGEPMQADGDKKDGEEKSSEPMQGTDELREFFK